MIITEDDVFGAVVMASHCESSPSLFDECRLRARWPLRDQPRTCPAVNVLKAT